MNWKSIFLYYKGGLPLFNFYLVYDEKTPVLLNGGLKNENEMLKIRSFLFLNNVHFLRKIPCTESTR